VKKKEPMKKKLIAVIWILIPFSAQSTWALSPGMESLHYFFNQIKTFEARFGQIVLDESLNSIDDGQGKVWIERPGFFRWVTVREQQQALGNTPAILLSGSGNLEDSYHIDDIGRQGRFDWINLIPKDEDGGFNEVRIGFEENRLRLMELLDNLGQRTRISFVDLKENLPIPATTFDFILPDGVDIIDNTRQ